MPIGVAAVDIINLAATAVNTQNWNQVQGFPESYTWLALAAWHYYRQGNRAFYHQGVAQIIP
jgi:hypothetical protein